MNTDEMRDDLESAGYAVREDEVDGWVICYPSGDEMTLDAVIEDDAIFEAWSLVCDDD